jgi:hypothetical protein
MGIPVVLFVLELAVLFLLSRALIQSMYTLIFLVTRSRAIAISLVTVILFPGTVIHELSHLFTAEVLGVHTGKLELAPDSIRGEEITTGSVMIAKTGPLRRALIGVAPTVIGVAALSAVSYFLPNWTKEAIVNINIQQYISLPIILLLSGLYVLFAISNTMFSSAVDLAGFAGVAIVIILVIGALYLSGFRIVLTGTVLTVTTTVFSSLVKHLGIVIGVNIILLIIGEITQIIVSSITHRSVLPTHHHRNNL